ncbi:MAG: hypothetical protein QNI90_09105 [Dinoroseobacter sp.]|nr:hypothetical protein [Dinoroseobacter sp.]
MIYVLFGLYLGAIAGMATLNAGGGLVMAFGLFSLFGALSLVAGFALAALCVLRTELLASQSS